MKGSRIAAFGLLAMLAMNGPALAMERWGRCVEVDARFHKIVVMQDGNKRHFPLRINGDTIFVLQRRPHGAGGLVQHPATGKPAYLCHR